VPSAEKHLRRGQSGHYCLARQNSSRTRHAWFRGRGSSGLLHSRGSARDRGDRERGCRSHAGYDVYGDVLPCCFEAGKRHAVSDHGEVGEDTEGGLAGDRVVAGVGCGLFGEKGTGKCIGDMRTEHQYWEAYCLLRTILGKAVRYNDTIDLKKRATLLYTH
jgi:hypothetical protein